LVHVTCVIASISGFTLRGGLMLAGSPLLWNRWIRTPPHFDDSLLLGSGLWLIVKTGQYPGTASWLTAKLVGLFAYVALGAFALRYGRTYRIRSLALVGALGAVGYIALVALHRDPWLGWSSWRS
jgi:uncharacterized membrane protein SirB2